MCTFLDKHNNTYFELNQHGMYKKNYHSQALNNNLLPVIKQIIFQALF